MLGASGAPDLSSKQATSFACENLSEPINNTLKTSMKNIILNTKKQIITKKSSRCSLVVERLAVVSSKANKKNWLFTGGHREIGSSKSIQAKSLSCMKLSPAGPPHKQKTRNKKNKTNNCSGSLVAAPFFLGKRKW